MLIRFILENAYSFSSKKEFNMLPASRIRHLPDHVYKTQNISLLKMASLYGANGAGKSNLIKGLSLLQDLVVEENVALRFNQRFGHKFNGNNKGKPISFIIEFIQGGVPFLYGIEIGEGIVSSEALYRSGLGESKDQLIYERKSFGKDEHVITFSEHYEQTDECKTFKKILTSGFISSDKSTLKTIANQNNKYLDDAKKAFAWFSSTLQIVLPETRVGGLAHILKENQSFKNYAEQFMQSFNIGITSIDIDTRNANEIIDEDNESAKNLLEIIGKSPNGVVEMSRNHGKDSVVLVKSGDDIFAEHLLIGHKGGKKGDEYVKFDLDDESDGTVRLLHFVPAFKDVISDQRVYVIDEIERSVHPLMIKELVRKFSHDKNTKGQLIFTTHESNLLDQDLFRQDEIWLIEKDNFGSSDLYSLSSFYREHKTIDIRKGYLSGRYGAIPFTGNLSDFNWDDQ